MTPAEIIRKLAQIAKLPADEIPGWVHTMNERGPFDGEVAAIAQRKKDLAK